MSTATSRRKYAHTAAAITAALRRAPCPESKPRYAAWRSSRPSSQRANPRRSGTHFRASPTSGWVVEVADKPPTAVVPLIVERDGDSKRECFAARRVETRNAIDDDYHLLRSQ